jgi:multiple sugar transport system substrate-binding protein
MTDLDRHAGVGRSAARQVVKFTVAVSLAASLMSGTVFAQSVDLSQWSPEYVKSIAGSTTYDTAKDCGAVVPNDYTGRVSYWYTGPFEADPEISHRQDAAFWEAFKADVPEHRGHRRCSRSPTTRLLDKLRTSRCSARPRRWSCACRSSAASSSRQRAS